MKIKPHTLKFKELILSTVKVRGVGNEYDPVRVITEIFDKKGNKIAENDPSNINYDNYDMLCFAKYVVNKIASKDYINCHVEYNYDLLDDWKKTLKNE